MARPKKYYERPAKKTNADLLADWVDNKPIAGIGDSLKDLDAKLKAIDDETATKNNSETSL